MKLAVKKQKLKNLNDNMNINAKETMKIAGGGIATSALSGCREVPCQPW
ncbi:MULTISPECIES: hypothetical protein [unclassified Pseudoalteromonas]|nr:hypothetical protein [Pseudoalteromonas sp. XMcav2-N]MCO7190272.1 hypothetical protein [Pseudoalteromonas sp. XMcav2-N]